MTTYAGQRLSVRGQYRRGSNVQGDGSLEIDQGLHGMAKLEEGEAAIHPRLRELVIELECMIISGRRFGEPTASGKAG